MKVRNTPAPQNTTWAGPKDEEKRAWGICVSTA